MRVVIVASCYYPELNGGSTNLHQRIEWLSNFGHEVMLVSPDYTGLPVYDKEEARSHQGNIMKNVFVHTFKARPFFLKSVANPYMPFTFHKEAGQAIIDFKPDVIQVESPERCFWGFMVPIGVNLIPGVPTVAVNHTDYALTIQSFSKKFVFLRLPIVVPWFKTYYRYLYNSYNLALVNTEMTRDTMRTYGVERVKALPFLGINMQRFNVDVKPTDHKEVAALSKDVVKIMYLGRWDADKWIHVLQEGYDVLNKRAKRKYAIIFVGYGAADFEENLRKWGETRENVILVGRIPNDKAPAYYRGCDIFVTPSPNETTGLTVVEAMACGKPAIGPNKGGIARTIQHRSNGLLFESGSGESLADCVEMVLEDEELRKCLYEKGIETAKEFSIQEATRNQVRVWEQLIDGSLDMSEFENAKIKPLPFFVKPFFLAAILCLIFAYLYAVEGPHTWWLYAVAGALVFTLVKRKFVNYLFYLFTLGGLELFMESTWAFVKLIGLRKD